MRAIVTGGAGFIGSHLVDALVERGDEVICVDDSSAPENKTFHWNDGAKNVNGDVRDPGLISLYPGADVVFHLAARSRIQPTVSSPTECLSVNVLGTQEVLEASRLSGVPRVVYAGSSSYYGNRNTPPFTEDMLPGCATPYSLSKWQGEQICELYQRIYGLSTISLRYFNVYGPREPTTGEYSPVVGLFRRQFRTGQPITLVGSGEQRRDFTFVSDIVRATLLAAEHPDVHGIINVGTGRSHSIRELAQLIGGPNATVDHIPDRFGETHETLADNSRARQEFSWKPEFALADGLNAYGLED